MLALYGLLYLFPSINKKTQYFIAIKAQQSKHSTPHQSPTPSPSPAGRGAVCSVTLTSKASDVGSMESFISVSINQQKTQYNLYSFQNTATKAYHSPPYGGGVRGWGFAGVGGGALRGCGVAYSSSVGLISSICSCTILRLNTLSSIVYAMSKLRFDLM